MWCYGAPSRAFHRWPPPDFTLHARDDQGRRGSPSESRCAAAPRDALIKRVNQLPRDHPQVLSVQRSGEAWRLAPGKRAFGSRTLLARIAEDLARFLSDADPRLAPLCQRAVQSRL
jgi:hypothetical protein